MIGTDNNISYSSSPRKAADRTAFTSSLVAICKVAIPVRNLTTASRPSPSIQQQTTATAVRPAMVSSWLGL
eukprot:759158-Hanusia_phi.AAC.1